MTDEAIKLADRIGYIGAPTGHICFTPSQLTAYFERAKQIGRDEDVRHVRYSKPVGATFNEMAAVCIRSELYSLGDAVLVWANEGDLCWIGTEIPAPKERE